MDYTNKAARQNTENSSSKSISKNNEEETCDFVNFANLSDKAKEVVCRQLLDITFFPERKFTEKQYSNSWTAPVYHVDNDSDAIRVYREGLLAGYLYSLDIRGQEVVKWKKMQDINNILLATESEFNGLIIRLSTNLRCLGISAGENNYIYSFGLRDNIELYTYFLDAFYEGRRICEVLWQDAIEQLKDARKEISAMETGQANGNDNAKQRIDTYLIDVPALEALLFLKMTFSQKTVLDSVHGREFGVPPTKEKTD